MPKKTKTSLPTLPRVTGPKRLKAFKPIPGAIPAAALDKHLDAMSKHRARYDKRVARNAYDQMLRAYQSEHLLNPLMGFELKYFPPTTHASNLPLPRDHA